MCEVAEEQCGVGDVKVCRRGCEDCRIEDICAPTRAVKEALKKPR